MVGSFLLKGSRLTQAKRFHIITTLLLGSSVAEQVTVNHLVAGSNPARAAIFTLSMIKIWPFLKFTMQCPSTDSHELRRLSSVAP